MSFIGRLQSERYNQDIQDESVVDENAGYIELKTLRDQIQISNREFNLTDSEVDKIITKYFMDKSHKSYMVCLDMFFKFFVLSDHQLSVKIIANNYLNITMKRVELIYKWIESKAAYHFDSIDVGKNEYLLYSGFEKLIMIIFSDSENQFKISDYFRYNYNK